MRGQLLPVRVRKGVQGVAEGAAQGRGPAAHPGCVERGPNGNALAKWALAEGRPRDDGGNEDPFTLAHAAAEQGHLELVVSRIGEGGFALNKWVMEFAAPPPRAGAVGHCQWLRAEYSATRGLRVG